MLYRLPFLFSASFFVILLLARIGLFGLVFSGQHIDLYNICLIALNDLTSFFFIFILSNIFFYQNKIYFYIRKNKLRMMVLAIIFVVIYLVIEYFLLQLSTLLFLRQFTNIYNEYNDSISLESYSIVYVWIKIVTHVWLFICIGMILYYVMKWGRGLFQTPLIDSITQSYQQPFRNSELQLRSNMSEQDLRKFYAIIFSSVFCCVINGLVWNLYFNLLSSVEEINIMFSDYYVTIFIFAFVSLIINYIFLYHVSKTFIKTRNWLPISSLLIASAITVVLFIFLVMMVTFFIMPIFFTFNTIVMLGIWLIICYVLLYFLTRFTLQRYFA